SMNLALTPELYDPKSDPAEVYPKLCSIDSGVAEAVLKSVHDITFVEHRTDAADLCSGRTNLTKLAEKARVDAERRAIANAETQRRFTEDALALLAVADDAKRRGDV